MLSEDVLVPTYNGYIITIAQIIINFMSSAAEAKLEGFLSVPRKWSLSGKLLMKWASQSQKLPIQCDNSTAVGVANQTIIPQKTKSMDMQFH